jgi:hypothetical protein
MIEQFLQIGAFNFESFLNVDLRFLLRKGVGCLLLLGVVNVESFAAGEGYC